ncbi:hypothetical protein LTR17_008382 [Elasticomyces elasticus]|nr:hypothetical protein LTR17_008382 [Elasticomyces elasticus]
MPAAASCVQKFNTNGTYCTGDNFAADPDVAGVSVVAAFAITSVLACAFSLIYLIVQLWKWRQWRRSKSEDKSRKERAESKFLEGFIGSCNDQQMFTGLAYLLGSIGPVGLNGIPCNISAYHWNVVANMGLISSATFMVTTAVSKRFFENRILGLSRVALMAAVSASLYKMSDTSVPYQIPHTTTEAMTNLTWPAACFAPTNETSLHDESNMAGINRVSEGLNDAVFVLIFISTAGRFLPPLLGQGCKWARLSPEKYRMMSILLHVFQWPILAFGTFVIIHCCVTIKNLRSFIGSTALLADPGESNPEDEINTFGQYIPLVLLALLPLTMAEVYFGTYLLGKLAKGKANASNKEHYKEKHMAHRKTGLSRWFWLLVLGPDKVEYEEREELELTELIQKVALGR